MVLVAYEHALSPSQSIKAAAACTHAMPYHANQLVAHPCIDPLNGASCARSQIGPLPREVDGVAPVPATLGDSDLPSASVNCPPVMDLSSRSCMTRVAFIVARAAHRRSVL